MTSSSADLKIFQACFDLTLEKGWSNVALSEIAARAGMELSQLVERFPSKARILDGYGRSVDQQMMAVTFPPAASLQERLSSVLMKRMELMAPHRRALSIMLRQSADDLASLGLGVGHLYQSMGLALETASVPSTGLRGIGRVHALGGVYVYNLRSFLKGEGEDLSATKAALDQGLAKILKVGGRLWPSEPFVDQSNKPLPPNPAPSDS